MLSSFDRDSIWDGVDEQMKNAIQYKNSPDGEFWMSMDDFCKEFEEVSICTIGPDYDGDGIADYTGYVKAIKGSWQTGLNAGGSRNDIEKFATNPQYVLTLKNPGEHLLQWSCSRFVIYYIYSLSFTTMLFILHLKMNMIQTRMTRVCVASWWP